MTDSPRTQSVRDTLARAVQLATGIPSALPRPGQLALVDAMTTAADPLGGHMAGIAPTGVGKSLSALSEAAVGAANYDERWIISTHSVGLQSQYLDKDGPPVIQAAKEVLGKDISIAVLKGWGQYTCVMKARETAQQMGVPANAAESKIINVAKRVEKLRLGNTVAVDGVEHNARRVQPLVAWALAQHANPDAPGDRGDYTGQADDQDWSTVSVTTAECLGEATCPLAAVCKPLAARQNASEADIVVTNHSMLAVQAATGTPVVIGSAKLGPFHGIVVDEAHTLPGIVRAQGQSQISGGRVAAVARRVRAATDERRPDIQKWMADGVQLVNYIDQEILRDIPGNQHNSLTIPETVDPLEVTGDTLTDWLRRGSRYVNATLQGGGGSMSKTIAAKRVIGDIDQMIRSVDSVREHWVGTARWWEPARQLTPADMGRREWASVQSAPVLVGKMIERNLWNEVTPATEETEEEIRPLSVACISATLPEGFPREVGLKAVPQRFQSPFDDAYAGSMLFIPRAVDTEDVEKLSTLRYGKRKFNTQSHMDWAALMMVKLVAANTGSALILSSTVTAGKRYTELLRREAKGRWNVYSQWDGESTPVITSRWRDDKRSVLIGTRSLMTGVDAPGETNTLVIVDRAPRSASNPVDDARVETLTEAFGGDKWVADRLVYVSDAVLLLDQAVGRLIRSVSDTGLAAVLDPRMLNAGPFKYQTQVRQAYLRALERFTVKTSNTDEAINYLKTRAQNS